MKGKNGKINRGFTLIELLTVVSIIALLVSILLPALHQARLRSQKTVCASRLRQLSVAAIHCALEDRNEKLPTGGLIFKVNALRSIGQPTVSVYPPPVRPAEPAGDVRIEDATMLSVGTYFQLAEKAFGRVVGTPNPTSRQEIDELAQRYHIGQMQRLFVCPAAENKGPQFDSDLPVFANQKQFWPAIVPYAVGSRRTYAVQTGYWYFGGFETDRWSWTARLGGFVIKPYRAPVRLSDSGQAVLLTDPVTIWPLRRQLIVSHTPRGYLQKDNELFMRPDIKSYVVGAATAIGTLDGAVEHKPLEQLFYRPAYAENGVLMNDLMTMF